MNTTRNLCMPLTLIKVPLEHLYEKSSSKLISNMLQQTKGVNNLLTDPENISRISASPGCLSLANHELSMFLRETVNRFSDHANKKCITLRQVDEPALITVCLNRERMAAILRNLLMAFTDNIDWDGEILLSTPCNTRSQELRLGSKDDGLLEKEF